MTAGEADTWWGAGLLLFVFCLSCNFYVPWYCSSSCKRGAASRRELYLLLGIFLHWHPPHGLIEENFLLSFLFPKYFLFPQDLVCQWLHFSIADFFSLFLNLFSGVPSHLPNSRKFCNPQDVSSSVTERGYQAHEGFAKCLQLLPTGPGKLHWICFLSRGTPAQRGWCNCSGVPNSYSKERQKQVVTHKPWIKPFIICFSWPFWVWVVLNHLCETWQLQDHPWGQVRTLFCNFASGWQL